VGPGDGSDTVEGGAGNDTLLFNGSAIGEIFDASANGTRVRFTRNIGSIVMDFDDIENLNLNALGGADTLTVNNLGGTDLISINANLAGTLGGSSGDAQADSIIVNATAGNDTVNLAASSGSVIVTGLSATLTISGSEAAIDRITVNTLGGSDFVDASALPAGLIGLVVDGGADDDVLVGSGGADTLLGGSAMMC
jgi:Ca2+-binding RTX toxin-like protein